MNHLTEEELLDAYYKELPDVGRQHLTDCPICRTELDRISELLDEVRSIPVPARNETYGREVWARVESLLPVRKPWWRRMWLIAPAAAAVLAATFFAGMLTMRTRQQSPIRGISAANQAVLSASGLSEK